VADASGTERRHGPRELGIRIGEREPGKLNALWFARDVRCRQGSRVSALVRDNVRELLAARGRLERRPR